VISLQWLAFKENKTPQGYNPPAAREKSRRIKKPQGASAPAADKSNYQKGYKTCPAGGTLNRRLVDV
jgi:hypothetical protein